MANENPQATRAEIERLKSSNESHESLIRSMTNQISSNKEKITELTRSLTTCSHLKGTTRPDLYND